jgi:hypothetical protein
MENVLPHNKLLPNNKAEIFQVTERTQVQHLPPLWTEIVLDAYLAVENTNYDNGFIACAAQAPGAIRHTTTTEAVNNLLNCGSAKPAYIIGHGSPGCISTGGGQVTGNVDQHIEDPRFEFSRANIERLRNHFPGLVLYGCHVGADRLGAHFLWQVAKAISRPVYAPTGLCMCNGGHFFEQPGSQLQQASPGMQAPPPPISAPPEPPKFRSEPTEIVLQGRIVRIESIGEIEYVILSRFGHFTITWSGLDLRRILKEVVWDHPLIMDGNPAARLTGKLKIKFTNGEANFSVYNNLLMQSVEDRRSFFYLTKDFGHILRQIVFS